MNGHEHATFPHPQVPPAGCLASDTLNSAHSNQVCLLERHLIPKGE